MLIEFIFSPHPAIGTEYVTWSGPDDFVRLSQVGSTHGGVGESKLLSVYEGFDCVVCSAALSTDGRIFVTSTNDGALHVWSVERKSNGCYSFRLTATLSPSARNTRCSLVRMCLAVWSCGT